MPRVPQYEQQVRVQNLPSARERNFITPEVLGADIARGVGQAANTLAGIAQREQEKADEFAVMGAERELAQLEQDLFHNPEGGAYATRGRDAFGLPERVFPRWEESVGKIEGRLTPRQRDAFRRLEGGRRSDLQRSLSRHILQESDRYYTAESQAYIGAAVDAAAANYTDQGRVGVELDRIARGVMTAPGMEGASPTVVNEAIKAAQSKALRAVTERMMTDDPTEAERYLLRMQDRMAVGDVMDLREKLQPLSQAREITAIADNIWDGGGAVAGSPAGTDGVWANMIRRESGGRQFDAKGAPLESSAGAIGIAQVMPGTGPEAARLAGLPWDEERYKTDADYNKAIGRAYFDKQVEEFGDVRLAAAAYNGGPGNVQKWLREIGDPRKGEISMDDFVAAIPFKETREYVQNVAPGGGTQQQASGGEPTLSGLMAQTRTIADPKVRRDVQADITRRWQLREAEEAERNEAMTEEINGLVENAPAGARLESVLSPDQLAWAQRQGKAGAWQGRLTNRINDAQVVTDPSTFTSLQTLFTKAENGDATAMAEVRAMNPVEYFDKLDPTARDYVQRRRGALVAPARSTEKPADFATEDELLRTHVFDPLGITAKPSAEEDEESAKLRTQFMQSYWARLNEKQKELGRGASSEEKQQIMRDLMLPFVSSTKNSFMGIALPSTETETRGFQVEVPDDDRAMIVDAFRRHNAGRNPSEAEIVAAYARRSGMRIQQGAP